MATWLITFITIMWGLQILLGWYQIQAFNKALQSLNYQGKIILGRNVGRFTPKTIIALAINEQDVIIDSLYMKGFTVFARPQKLNIIIGLTASAIDPQIIFKHDNQAKEALTSALSHYKEN